MKRISSAKNKMMPRSTTDVEAYLASLPADARTALEKLRKGIRSAAAGAEEVISYGLPAFRHEGRGLAWHGAFKSHCSFFPSSAVIRTYARDLKAYDTSKGTIRFSPEKPLSSSLVRKLVKARIAELRKIRR